ncbi:cysteine hydrolase [Cereibacter changlensis JA139]|uniref:Cysteine hydrolase n=2 Tax=Cereibacter changlensis TaxID=402884 RepID=A0A2T4JQH4_9RHOB|nr:cysteine hydrolase family protein [Cereibacter changlensis]PTE20164.1 cysteine hydrolase [Cereibacter changlensis JA139]PZX46895.1 nicotinamidase-related amidase [Cereibacter changlensis]
MSKRAVLVVDLQNEYWPSGNLPLQGIEVAAGNAARVIEHARFNGDLVVNIRHEAPGGPIFVPGSQGAEINEVVAPRSDEAVITKNFPNSFRDTDLKALLYEKGIKDVTVIGAMSHMCIDATTRAANDHGFKTTTIHDACATRDIEFGGQTVPAAHVHTAIMGSLAFFYGDVISTENFLRSGRCHSVRAVVTSLQMV